MASPLANKHRVTGLARDTRPMLRGQTIEEECADG